GLVLSLTSEDCVRRRDFIKVIAGSAGAGALTPRAPAPGGKKNCPCILQTCKPPQPLVYILLALFERLGYSAGHNIAYEYRWAEGNPDKLTELAKELADLKIDVITTLTTPAAIAAQKVTKTIPIVFMGVGDPVGTGVVPSLSHPGGNITGISLLAT